MTRHANEVTKAQLTEEFNAVVADTERLLKSAANAGSEKAGALRADVEQSLASAKDRLVKVQHAALEKTKATARVADEYVHEHPWQGIGIASGVAAALGVVIGLLLNRR
jgi:ElaB/YqjD/DUF883 family membrane-anchored ribosome-binding protein